MLKKLPALFAGLLLAFVAYAAADAELRADHPDSYVVRKGDTLWDISARFLKKPWLWPEVWQANPQIQNPHLIYPGDVINLAYLNGHTRLTAERGLNGPQVRTEPLEDSIKPIPLRDLRSLLKNMRIVDEATFKNLPHVVAIEENQLRGVNGNLVYVHGLDAAAPGSQFVIVRPSNVYYSMPPEEKGGPPSTHARELDTTHGQSKMLWHHGPSEFSFLGHVEVLGYEVMVIGQGKLTKAGTPSSFLVTYSDMEIRQGDLIMPVEDKPYDSQYLPHAPKTVPAEFSVLAFTDANGVVGPKQVVALSRGSQDGIENGQTFSIYHSGETVNDDYHYADGSVKKFVHPRKSKVTLPEEFIGHVMIFRTFDRVSYGLVMDGIRPVHLQDSLHAPE
ncbi:MAG: LysM domain-containing protein [Tahibacter sp.]